MTHLPCVWVQTSLPFFLHLSSFSPRQTSSVRTEIDLPRGCWKEVILQRDLLPVWPWGTQTLCSVQVCEPFLSLTLPFIERWIKDWQDLALHQSGISPAECKCYKQWGGMELLCLYCHSFFLAAGAESSLRPIPSLETQLSGVNQLVNSSLYFPNAHVCHQRDSLMSCLGWLVLLFETDSNKKQTLMISHYVDGQQTCAPL